MYPVIPAEMISGAAQMAVFFITIVAAFWSYMLTARA